MYFHHLPAAPGEKGSTHKDQDSLKSEAPGVAALFTQMFPAAILTFQTGTPLYSRSWGQIQGEMGLVFFFSRPTKGLLITRLTGWRGAQIFTCAV